MTLNMTAGDPEDIPESTPCGIYPSIPESTPSSSHLHRFPHSVQRSTTYGSLLLPLPSSTPHTLFGFRRSTFFLLIFIIVYVLSLCLISIALSTLESKTELQVKKRFAIARDKFLADHSTVEAEDLESFIKEVVNAQIHGVSVFGNLTTTENWSFGQSFFFAATVVTTIGYGHVHPLSESGKLFCIMFALVGVPFTIVLLTSFVERLKIPCNVVLCFLMDKLSHLYQPFYIRVLHLLCLILFILVIFFLLPSWVFMAIEPGWGYLDSIYYCFISLTSIGLGDFIPGDAPKQEYRTLYKAITTVYLYVGLSFMMLLLSVYSDIPQLNLGFSFLSVSDYGSDPERIGIGHYLHKNYLSGGGENIRHVRRVISRPDDVSSPEDITPGGPPHSHIP
ncbi:unnamed protein product [Cyprideis torosa]|uniref:Potassium channel domain-containing protein n=1 Tax=Cyprideis torosa TaxID=163714 RepID=A0A7R8W7T9_9CRUS|nr:unnamed protein product [Cyprideis torosa]CAG0885521.1 unnamed protein product [Cyprideis torosa]